MGAIAVASVLAVPPNADAAPEDEPTTVPTPSPTPTTAPPTTVAPTTTSTSTTVPRTTPPSTAPPTTAPPTTPPPQTTPAPTPTATPTTSPAPSPTTTTTPAPDGPVAPPQLRVIVYPEQIEYILATIRYLESRGNYLAPPNSGGASGAYQFVRSTWNNYGGYAHAYLAPPAVQDQRAAQDVTRFLAQFNNDVSMIPVMWYYPIAATQTEWMDRVPAPQFGNRLTIREYQTLWLRTFARISGTTIVPRTAAPPAAVLTPGEPPVLTEQDGDVPSLSFPVLGPSSIVLPQCEEDESTLSVPIGGVQPAAQPDSTADSATGSDTDSAAPWITVTSFADIHRAGQCSAQTPGVIVGSQLQPVLAVADGVITEVRDDPASGEPISITLTDVDGTSHLYSGFNDDSPGTDDGRAPEHLRLSALAVVGGIVRAGQVLGFMGNSAEPLDGMAVEGAPTSDPTVSEEASLSDEAAASEEPTVPPHIQIRSVDVNGEAIDTYGPIVDALFRQTCQVMIGPWSMLERESSTDPVTVPAPDSVEAIDSQWVVTSTGAVTASGWAAMVNPSDACSNAPTEMFGPGASGVEDGLLHWLEPIELSTKTWVAAATYDDPDSRWTILR